MSVKKIFVTLIVIVACVMLGALLLNVLFPNVTKTVVNAAEDSIFKATGMSFDFNNDGTKGKNNKNYKGTESGTNKEGQAGGNVTGFN